MSLLEVENLTIKDKRSRSELVKGLSFKLKANQCLGLVGESGCGKSLTCKAIMGVLDPWLEVSGKVNFDGRDLLSLSDETMREVRGARLGLIIQEAQSAFNPLFKIGAQMVETFLAHKDWSENKAWALAERALARLQLPEPESVMKKYPHQLSGGMLQRVMSAVTLALNPEVIIADEPTTALDCITQKEFIEQLVKIKQMHSSSIIFVSHDLAVVRRLADWVVVLRQGQIVEQGPLTKVFERPDEAYTKKLIDAHRALSQKFGEVMGPKVEAA